MNEITAFANGKFDPDVFNCSEYGMNASQMQYIYKCYADAPMHPTVINYWESHGAKKEMFELSGEEDRVFTVFTPKNREPNRRYPMIYCFHDKDDDAFLAETYGYTELVEKENIICVYPEYQTEGLTDVDVDFKYILSELKKRGYSIDEERIYVTGFHYGASAAAKLSMLCPGMLAGVGIFCGSHIFRGKILPGRIRKFGEYNIELPLICVSGNRDARNAWPLEEQSYFDTLKLWMKHVAHISLTSNLNVQSAKELHNDSDDKVKREFGLDFDETVVDFMEDTYWYRGDFLNSQQIPMMEFVSVEGLPHIHSRMVAVSIWNYLKQFSINRETKQCIYVPEGKEVQPY